MLVAILFLQWVQSSRAYNQCAYKYHDRKTIQFITLEQLEWVTALTIILEIYADVLFCNSGCKNKTVFDLKNIWVGIVNSKCKPS